MHTLDLIRSPLRMAPAALLLLLAAPAHAIFSCQVGVAGQGDSCGLNKYQAQVLNAVVDVPGYHVSGSASANPAMGALSALLFAADTASGGPKPSQTLTRFGSEIWVDFRITGPTGAPSVPTEMIFLGNIGLINSCPTCDLYAGYRFVVDSVGFSGVHFETSAGVDEDGVWYPSTSFYENAVLNTSATDYVLGPGTRGASFRFDAASIVGYTLRLQAYLSSNVNFTGDTDFADVTVDASHTALFNVLLPEGYGIQAVGTDAPLLTAPILQAVPEPRSAVLLAGGLAVVLLAARRRARWLQADA